MNDFSQLMRSDAPLLFLNIAYYMYMTMSAASIALNRECLHNCATWLSPISALCRGSIGLGHVHLFRQLAACKNSAGEKRRSKLSRRHWKNRLLILPAPTIQTLSESCRSVHWRCEA